jgi:hypothetical protein
MTREASCTAVAFPEVTKPALAAAGRSGVKITSRDQRLHALLLPVLLPPVEVLVGVVGVGVLLEAEKRCTLGGVEPGVLAARKRISTTMGAALLVVEERGKRAAALASPEPKRAPGSCMEA